MPLALVCDPAAKPSDPIVKTQRGKMLNRTAYTSALKAWLQRSCYNVHNNSGISWRKVSLSQLLGKIADSRAANFADHKSIETTRNSYVEDNISERVGLSDIIAAVK